MDKPWVNKKTGETMWRTKREPIVKSKKPMSGENNIDVFCSKNLSATKPRLWINGWFYARVIFTVKENDKLDILFTDGTRDSLFADDDQQSGIGHFGEKSTSWFSTYLLNENNIKNLTSKDIASFNLRAGPYLHHIVFKPEKREILKNQLILLAKHSQ